MVSILIYRAYSSGLPYRVFPYAGRHGPAWISGYIKKGVKPEREEKDMMAMALATATNAMDTVTNALTTSFTSVAGSIMGVIGDVLPIALPVVGAVMVITVGIKIFKRLVNK